MAERDLNYCEVIGNSCDQSRKLACGGCIHASSFVRDWLDSKGCTGRRTNKSSWRNKQVGRGFVRDENGTGTTEHTITIHKGSITTN